MIRMRSNRLMPICTLLLAAAACNSAPPCEPQLTLTPAPDGNGVLSVAANRGYALTAAVDTCGAAIAYSYEWFYDADGNGSIDGAETTPVADLDVWTGFACAAEVGDHALRIVATPLGDVPSTTPTHRSDVVLRVEDATAAPRAACVDAAIATIRDAGDVADGPALAAFDEASACLDTHLESNLCDFQAAAASSLAHLGTFAARLPQRWADRQNLTLDEILAIGANEFTEGLNPLIIGLFILAIGLSLGGTTGYAINPARDLGPRLVHALAPIAGKGSSDWGYAWIPVVGPAVGGTLAALAYLALGGGEIPTELTAAPLSALVP